MEDIILKPIKKNCLVLKQISSIKEISLEEDLKNYNGYLIDACEKEARRISDSLRQLKKKQEIVLAILGRDDNFNRRAPETLNIKYLVSPEREMPSEGIIKKDTLKQRDSGFNHVLGKIAREKNISIVIDFSDTTKTQDKKQKAVRLSRIIQNIKICQRTKCQLKIATFAQKKDELRDEKEIKSFGFSLGMSSQQVKDCFEF